MRYRYKRVDIRTLKGLQQAEQLKLQGWRLISVGIDILLFEKEVK